MISIKEVLDTASILKMELTPLEVQSIITNYNTIVEINSSANLTLLLEYTIEQEVNNRKQK